MDSEIMANFTAFKDNDWFVDFFHSKITPELIEYFVLSEDNRKRVTSHNILAASNPLALTKPYTNTAKFILTEINKRRVNG